MYRPCPGSPFLPIAFPPYGRRSTRNSQGGVYIFEAEADILSKSNGQQTPHMDTHNQTALMKEIEALKARLEKEQYENAMLRRLLFSQYAKHPRPMKPLDLPISERAIVLFEVLPEAFDLEEALATAEKLDLTESEAAEHIRTYFQEGMLEDSEENKHFIKTGHRPYI